MKVSAIKIHNILGIEECEFKTGKFVTVEGKNASGKSSIVKAIQSVFQGGHDATLLRNGAEQGEIVLVLDDGTNITKRITRDKSDLKASGQKAAKSFIDSISDIVSVNPVLFLTGDDKTRLKLLLEAIDIQLPEQRLLELTGAEHLPKGEPLEVIGTIRKQIYDNRTGANRAVREKTATIVQLQQTLPAYAVDTDFQQQYDKLADEISCDKAVYEEKKALAVNAYEETADQLRAEFDKVMEKLRTNHMGNLEVLRQVLYDLTTSKEKTLSELQQAISHEAVSKNTRQAIEQYQTELDGLAEEVANLESALEEIDSIKEGLLLTTPFKDLTIQDGKIYLKGVAFEHVNTASQVAFAIRLAKLRAGELGLVCLDNMESLDTTTLRFFKDAAQKSDLQFIITKVGESALTITDTE